jgi:hypothetical protein
LKRPPAFYAALLVAALCAIVALAEPPVSLPRPAATQPATVRSVETVQRLYWSDGHVTEKSVGVVTLLAGDTFAKPQ